MAAIHISPRWGYGAIQLGNHFSGQLILYDPARLENRVYLSHGLGAVGQPHLSNLGGNLSYRSPM